MKGFFCRFWAKDFMENMEIGHENVIFVLGEM